MSLNKEFREGVKFVKSSISNSCKQEVALEVYSNIMSSYANEFSHMLNLTKKIIIKNELEILIKNNVVGYDGNTNYYLKQKKAC